MTLSRLDDGRQPANRRRTVRTNNVLQSSGDWLQRSGCLSRRRRLNMVVRPKIMKSTQWLLLLFAALSLVSAFIVMKEGAMPVLFLLVALIASTCAQAVHVLHQRMDQIERKLDKDVERKGNQKWATGGRK
jgi:hypothetical protein